MVQAVPGRGSLVPGSVGLNPLPGGFVYDKEGDEREEHPDKEHSPEKHLHTGTERYHPQTKQCYCLGKMKKDQR